MKIIILLILFLAFPNSMAALGPLNHLIPADDFGQLYTATKHITAADLNIDREDEGYFLQFIRYPSFDLISSTVIIKNYETDEYRVAYSKKGDNFLEIYRMEQHTNFISTLQIMAQCLVKYGRQTQVLIHII